MSRILHQAETVRRRILQPLADRVYVHARVNCFVLASCLVSLDLGIVLASMVHGLVEGTWWAFGIPFSLLYAHFLQALARHLVRFQRRADGTLFRVVHPLFRHLEASSYLMCLFMPVIGTAHVLTIYGVTHSASATWWTVADEAGTFAACLGGYVASCEWRRLPPARKRERGAFTGMVTNPT